MINFKSLWHKVSVAHLACAFVILNVVDGAMTKALIDVGGTELSPIWNFFLSHTTAWEFVAFKLIGALAISLILLYLSMTYHNQIKRILAGLVIGMTVVVAINSISIGAYLAGL